MTVLLAYEELRSNARSVRFEGHRHAGDDVDVSFFVSTFEPGDGPVRHRHPYPEVFIVQEGEATFVVAGETLVVVGGNVVVVEAQTPHRFHNSAAAPLRVVSIHTRGAMVQTNLG